MIVLRREWKAQLAWGGSISGVVSLEWRFPWLWVVRIPNYSICLHNPFKALMRALEKAAVAAAKYECLKMHEVCRPLLAPGMFRPGQVNTVDRLADLQVLVDPNYAGPVLSFTCSCGRELTATLVNGSAHGACAACGAPFLLSAAALKGKPDRLSFGDEADG